MNLNYTCQHIEQTTIELYSEEKCREKPQKHKETFNIIAINRFEFNNQLNQRKKIYNLTMYREVDRGNSKRGAN